MKKTFLYQIKGEETELIGRYATKQEAQKALLEFAWLTKTKK